MKVCPVSKLRETESESYQILASTDLFFVTIERSRARTDALCRLSFAAISEPNRAA
jgi:hypothetical protein